MDVIPPNEMMDVLHAPLFIGREPYILRASFDMLRMRYREYPDHPKVREARLAMEIAISKWSDDQVTDFVLNHLLEPPILTELQSRPPSELRQFLVDIYNYLFEGMVP